MQRILCFLVWAGVLTCSVCLADSDCDIVIRSSVDGPKRGNFSSPYYPSNYADGMKCMIKFVGLPDERVQISFSTFDLNGFFNRLPGVSTGCTQDYIDIYTEIQHPDHDILELPLQGRYCGHDLSQLPHLLMSLNRTIIVTFDSNNDGKTNQGFFGHYEFISSEPYKLGYPAQFGACGWIIDSTQQPTGYIMAPYYPAIYPDNLDCFYRLEGKPGQRIRLEFTDFDLYYGGDHCPYDNLRIFDGLSSNDPEIGNYCNAIDNLVIYSTGSSLYLHFKTRSGRPLVEAEWGERVIQMRGFNATYTFDDRYVNLDFVRDDMEHLRGTECDIRVRSHGESSGYIVSPNFPATAPPNISCFYYIDGLVDTENLEKVILNFSAIYLPNSDQRCMSDGPRIASYLFGQKPTNEQPDGYICDRNKPSNLISKNPRLALRFTTGPQATYSAVGFKAMYQFVIDYAIEGTPATLGAVGDCHFIYYSSSSKMGKINSPRYPSAYPNDITCTYELIAEPKEFIMISFETFDVERIAHDVGECLGDRLSAESIIPQADNTSLQIPMGKYCGVAYPGPLVSEWLTRKMVITFKSDEDVALRGFQAKYEFLPSVERFPCGGNITHGGSGEIVPPNYPLKYKTRTVCDWFIYRNNPQAQIKITFDHFDIEGTMEEGCQGAVLRIYKSEEYKVDYEICGQEAPLKNIISENGFIRIKFISSSKSFGKTGFKIYWTEVIQPGELGECTWFQCSDKKLCIPETSVCNDRVECLDGSDEGDCGMQLSRVNILYIIIAVVIFVLLVILITICICIRHGNTKKKIKKQPQKRGKSSPSYPITHDPELLGHDRLSKAPMLPTSLSTSSSFNPYDPHNTGHHPYDPQPLINQYEPVPYDHHSTLSSKCSYTTVPTKPDSRYLHRQGPYDLDMNNCHTSF